MTDEEYMNELVEMLNITQNAFDICVRNGECATADIFRTQAHAYRIVIKLLNNENKEIGVKE